MTVLSKKNLRLEARKIRMAAKVIGGINVIERATTHALKLISPLPTETTVIALYIPVGDEMDCRFLQQTLENQGYKTALPVILAKDQPLTFRLWGQGDPLEDSHHGTQQPASDAPAVTPTVMITPLLAFNRDCYRLGWGGGYYDRTLAANTDIQAFGFAYAAQYMEDMPVEAHDWPMHGIITEEGMILPTK